MPKPKAIELPGFEPETETATEPTRLHVLQQHPSPPIVETITPELAREYIKFSTRNRKVQDFAVDDLGRAMRAGEWKLNGETIKFSTKGLEDGQHRLLASIRWEATFDTYVVRGLAPDVFDTIDIGRKRSAADVLQLLGAKAPGSVAAAIKLLTAYEKKIPARELSWFRMTPDQIKRRFIDDPKVAEAIYKTYGVMRFVPLSAAGMLWYLFSKIDEAATAKFFDDLQIGYVQKTDPVAVLRERLYRNKVAKAKLPRHEIITLVVRTWNARREGRNLKSVRTAVPYPEGTLSPLLPDIK